VAYTVIHRKTRAKMDRDTEDKVTNEQIDVPTSHNSQAKRMVKSFSIDRRVYHKFKERVQGECESRVVEHLLLHYLGMPHPEAQGMAHIPTAPPSA
jgi:hypothetical protein